MDPNTLYWLLAIVIGVIFPIYGLWGGPKAKELLIEKPEKRIFIYKQAIIIQVTLTSLVFAAVFYNKDPVDLLWLTFLNDPLAIVALAIIPLVGLWALGKMKIPPGRIEKIKSNYEEVSYLMPHTTSEYRWSIGLSITAGICEEILYRGFIYWQLTLFLPFAGAVVITNFIFAMLHYGTGLKNAFYSFLLGMFFSLLSIYFESLWPAILAHILIDFYSMTIGYKVHGPDQSEVRG